MSIGNIMSFLRWVGWWCTVIVPGSYWRCCSLISFLSEHLGLHQSGNFSSFSKLMKSFHENNSAYTTCIAWKLCSVQNFSASATMARTGYNIHHQSSQKSLPLLIYILCVSSTILWCFRKSSNNSKFQLKINVHLSWHQFHRLFYITAQELCI